MASRWIGAVLCLCLLSACGGQETAETSETTEAWQHTEQELTLVLGLPAALMGLADDLDRLGEWIDAQAGIPTELKRVSGNDGVIQAMAADQADVAAMGAGAFTSLYDLIGDNAQPILAFRGHMGDLGYYGVLVVRADSPHYSIEDLKGKRIGYPDFNSTSGYIFPRNQMIKEGIDPETYFSEVGVTGGHAQAIMALAGNQFDAVFTTIGGGTPELGFTNGTIITMAQRGIIDSNDFRNIWYAGPIPTSAYVIRGDRDPAFVDMMTGIIASLPYEQPGALSAYGLRRSTTFKSIDKDFFQTIIDMRAAEIAGERQVSQ